MKPQPRKGRIPKGQTSLDFLMTYGWAVLLVVVVVASLFALGVFNSGSFLGPRATGFAQVGVIAWNVNAAGVLALRLQNFAGMDINVVNIEATYGTSHFPYDITNVSIPNGKISDTFTVGAISGLAPGQYYTLPLRIVYTDINGFNYTETGTISGTVGAGAVPPSIQINSPHSDSLLNNRTINISVSVWGANLSQTDIMIIDETGTPVNVTTNSQLGTYSVLLDVQTDGVYNITALANYTDGGSASATASNITVNVSVQVGLQCGDPLDIPDHVYTLSGDVSSGGTCFTIGADNVTLDCDGHSITGNGSGYGINNSVGYNYTAVKNCIVENFSEGIDFENGASFGTISNNTATSNGDGGIQLVSSSNNTIVNNTFNSNWIGALLRSGSNYNFIANNTAGPNGEYGIYLESSSNNTIANNTVDSNHQGIMIYSGSNYNIITDNTARFNSDIGIFLMSGSNHNMISNNNATSNPNLSRGAGIALEYGDNYNTVTNNTASLSSIGIVVSYSSSYNNITDNNASSNVEGIYFYFSANNNIVANNTASSNSDGIILDQSSNNVVANNTFSSNSGSSIWFHESSGTGNLIYNNFLNSTAGFTYDGDIYANSWNTTLDCSVPGANIIGGDCIGGNVWAQPDGFGFSENCSTNGSSNESGICTVPYEIDGSNVDELPLANFVPPQISVSITAPLNDSIVGNLTFAVNFTAGGAGLNITNVTLINETGSIVAWNSSQSSGPVSITLTAPSNGTYAINATAYNSSAGVASSIVSNITVNTAVAFPCGVYAVGGNGLMKIIAPDGNMSTFTNLGPGGYQGITSDGLGWMYALSYNGSVIRISSDGTYSQIANVRSYGSSNGWFKITVDDSRNLYAIDYNTGYIVKIAPNWTTSLYANVSNYSGSCWSGVTWSSGNLYAFTCNGPVIKIAPNGSTSQFANLGSTYWSWHSATDGAGNLYTLDYNSHLGKITPDGTVISLPSLAYVPWKRNGYYDVAADSAGNVYGLDYDGPVTKVTPYLTLSEIGDFGTGVGWPAIYRYESGVCKPPPTPLFVNITSPASDSAIESSGTMTIGITTAGNYLNRTNVSIYNSTGGLVNSTMNYSSGPINVLLGVAPGDVYTITATAYDHAGNGVSSTVSNVTVNAMTAYPCGVYAVSGNGLMKIIAPDGNMSQFANLGAGSGYQGITSDSSGRLYAVSYTGVVIRMGSDGTFSQFANIGGNQFKITADDSGNLYSIDYDTGYVTKIASDGTSSRLASLRSYAGSCWSGITWHSGYIYAATCNGPVIRIAPNGSTSQFATLGGTYWGWHIASDGAGNIHALDYSSNLKKIDPEGNVIVRPNLGSVPWKRNGYYAVAADSAGNVYGLDYDGPVTKVFPDDTMIEYGDLGTGVGWPGIYRYEYPTCKTMYITTFSLANASVNNPYSKTLNLSGGVAPFTWSIVSGSLPDNMSLDSSAGVINGTPTALGTYTFTAQVVDSVGANATQALSINVVTCTPVGIVIQGMQNWNPPDECVDLKQYDFLSLNSYVCYYNDGCWAGMWGPSNNCWIGFGGNAIAFTYNTPCSQAQPGDFNDQNQGGCGQGSQTWGGCVAPNPTHTCIKDLGTGTMQDFDVAADGTLTLTSSCS